MGSTNFLKPKSGYRAKSGSSAGSDKDINGKFRRPPPKIRRPSKDFGLKRIPDYTDLAYKEAVSKLRYFLSGNYAPSVRSYGSPSIKNLDEPDELDKKYYTMAEYKPRPRLTAKYTTLYADSLNNKFGTKNVGVSVAPPTTTSPADLTGGTNPDVIHFIQKQEEYIEQLERESQYCRDELNNLLGKVKEVISENEHLHEAQKNKLMSRMFHTYNAGSETDDLDDFGDSTGLDSDNKGSPLKPRRSMKVRSTKLEGPNIVFESRISELEAQLAQSKIDLKKVQDENNENKRKLAAGLVDSTCLDGFKRQIDNLQRDKNALEAQISKLKVNLEQRDGDLDGKYRKGSDMIEQQLREERNNLEVELRRLKEDLSNERSKVRELATENARRAHQERSAAEQRYNLHFDELQHDLAAQYDNVAKLQLELERQRREENDLKRELSMKNSAIEELKMELKNKTATLQADLAQAHAEKASLEEELASARLAMERHQRQAKHEANRLNSEIQSLRQRLDRADADLVHSRRENLRLSEQISTLEKEINMKNLTPISPEKKKDKEMAYVESIENKHAKTVAELETMIQSQNSLMDKLTGECRMLTDKLDDANRRHKKELATLQRQVDSLGRTLQNPHSTYSAPTPHIPTTTRVLNPAATTRPEYSPDPTRYTYDRPEPHRTSSNLSHASNRPNSDAGSVGSRDGTNSRPFSRQASRQSINSQKEIPQYVSAERLGSLTTPAEENKYGSAVEKPEKPFEEQFVKEPFDNNNKTVEDVNQDVAKDNFDTAKPTEIQDYEQQNYVQYDTPGHEQNHVENPQYSENVENVYQNQEYGSQGDTTQAQYDNYEQYPQYTDPQYSEPNSQYNVPNPEYIDPKTQYVDPSTQYAEPITQYVDPNTQYTDPNTQYADPKTQYVDPNTQYTDPNTQYTDPNTQYADPESQYVDPNTQYTDPNINVDPNTGSNIQYADPNTQYTDPNTQHAAPNPQYTDQYGNSAEGTYQQQNYEPQYTEHTQEYKQMPPKVNPEKTDPAKRSNTPNEKVSNQS